MSVFLHELGHALAAKLVRVEVKSIVIWLLGGFTNLSREPEKPIHRLAIYAAGPFVTVLLGVLFIVAYFYTPFNPTNFLDPGSKVFSFRLQVVNISRFCRQYTTCVSIGWGKYSACVDGAVIWKIKCQSDHHDCKYSRFCFA